ncbi:hypothetical protein C8Q75DRAFT_724520 [Abortiporus biennis]|nr:hypothetical protein C8Q75DRAFT_724520 [Abortiporus biennis]
MVALKHSSIHHASLVDSSLHSPQMLELLEIDLSRNFIEYVVDCVVETVDYAMGRPSGSSRGRSYSRHSQHEKFTKFVTDVVHKAEVTLPVLLVSLVYIDRAKPHLQIALEQWACERVFLGALILANKYTNDSTLKNIHWALCTGVFGKRDVGRIEREFLDVLDFELGVSESDILSHHDSIIALVHPQQRIRAPTAAHIHHHTHRNAVDRHTSPRSRWSSDSSDLDSLSSVESMSPPHTPAHVGMDIDSASYVQPSSKHTPEEHPTIPVSTVTTSKPQPKAESVHSTTHHRIASAFSILRSFPLPHFHHSQASSHPLQSTSSSASSSSTLVSASASLSNTAFSIPSCTGVGCKPVDAPHLAVPPVASVFV